MMLELPPIFNEWRIVSQGLIPATSSSTPEEAVSRHLAMQGQQVSAFPHAVLSRTESARFDDVRKAFDERTLIRSRPMRGTVHITTAGDYHWLRATLHRDGSWNAARRAELGIDFKLVECAAELAWQRLAVEGQVTRKQLFACWEELARERKVEEKKRSRWSIYLMYALDLIGAVIEGPMLANEHAFIDARTLPAADSGLHGPAICCEEDRELGYIEVARRYVDSHGPVDAADLSRWASLSMPVARRALESAMENSAGGIVRIDATGAAASSVKNAFYMRADVPDIAAEHRKAVRATHFLASFDELHVGYKNRTCLTDEHGETLICPAKNGMFRPLIVDAAKLVAVRPVSLGIVWKNEPSKRLAQQTERAVSRMEKRLAR